MVEGFEHPPAGEIRDRRTIENTEVCTCGNVFVDDDDYDSAGSESGVCCPDCGNEKFQTVAINKELLAVCEESLALLENDYTGVWGEEKRWIGSGKTLGPKLEAAIAKAEQ